MELKLALDIVIKKEAEEREAMVEAAKEAEHIRYLGEENASEVYQKVRGELKEKILRQKSEWNRKLSSLEKKLSNDLSAEKKKMRTAAGKKSRKAEQAAYDFLVNRL